MAFYIRKIVSKIDTGKKDAEDKPIYEYRYQYYNLYTLTGPIWVDEIGDAYKFPSKLHAQNVCAGDERLKDSVDIIERVNV